MPIGMMLGIKRAGNITFVTQKRKRGEIIVNTNESNQSKMP